MRFAERILAAASTLMPARLPGRDEDEGKDENGAHFPVYAVVDGAKFDDLPALLFDNDLASKPLYLDYMGSEDVSVANVIPHMVRFDRWAHWENDLTPRARFEEFCALVHDVDGGGDDEGRPDADDDAPSPISGVVFWVHADPPKTLFRHLRTINNILIPRDEDTPPLPDPLDPDAEPSASTATHQQVLFRHADANVLAQVLPELGADRTARFLGPAHGVLCVPGEVWAPGTGADTHGLMSTPHPGGEWTAKARLQLSARTMERIEGRRLDCLRRQTAHRLTTHYPDIAAMFERGALLAEIERLEANANRVRLETYEDAEKYILYSLVTGDEAGLAEQLENNFNPRLATNAAYAAVWNGRSSAEDGS